MIANVLTIGLKLGDVLEGHVPIQYCEAREVGTGKTFLQELTAAFYGEVPYLALQREKGVGGLDETIAQGMAYGGSALKSTMLEKSCDPTSWPAWLPQIASLSACPFAARLR